MIMFIRSGLFFCYGKQASWKAIHPGAVDVDNSRSSFRRRATGSNACLSIRRLHLAQLAVEKSVYDAIMSYLNE